MKAPLPPNFQAPWWATKDFRTVLIVGVMACAVIGVLVFEVGPKLSQKAVRAPKAADQNAFVPRPADPGVAREPKFGGALESTKDGTSIDDRDQPYQTLVAHVANAAPDALSKEAKSVDYQYYSKLPAELRGQPVKILALFLQSSPVRLDPPAGGVQWVHRTYLADLTGREGYVVDLLEAPPELASRTLVATEAMFLKLGTYEGKKGSVQAPLFLGRGLHIVKERMSDGPVSMGGMIVGVSIVSGLGVILLSLRAIRNSRATPPAPPTLPKGPAVSLNTSNS